MLAPLITRIVFRCVPLSCIFLKANKNMGSSRRRFLFKYFWTWKLELSVICFQSSEVCIKNTNKSDGIDHYITEVGLKHGWPLRERVEPFSPTMFFPICFLQKWQSVNARYMSTMQHRNRKWKRLEKTGQNSILRLSAQATDESRENLFFILFCAKERRPKFRTF